MAKSSPKGSPPKSKTTPPVRGDKMQSRTSPKGGKKGKGC